MEVIRECYQTPKVTYNTPSHVLVIIVINHMLGDFSTEHAVALHTGNITEAHGHLIVREDWDKKESKQSITTANQILVVATKQIVQEFFLMMTYNL